VEVDDGPGGLQQMKIRRVGACSECETPRARSPRLILGGGMPWRVLV